MKICIYGAGAIGGLIGARLADSGNSVSVVARGSTLEAIRRHGLRLQSGGRLTSATVEASSDQATLGPQDLVVVAVKGPALADVAARIGPLLGPETLVLSAMNGVPWWFFDGFGGSLAGSRLTSIDPDGAIARGIPGPHVLGCVVHLSARPIEPGFIQHRSGNKLIVGEPDNTQSRRARHIAALLTEAGFEVELSPCIQRDIWFKLLGNMTHNPISALTGATCDRILDDSLVNRLCLAAMGEAARLGGRIGCPVTENLEERNAATRKLGAFKTSMLQDVEARKALELDAIIGAVSEIAAKLGEPAPFIDALFGLSRLMAQGLGLYPPATQ